MTHGRNARLCAFSKICHVVNSNWHEDDIAVAILFRTFLWTCSARPQKCPCPNRSGGCYIFEREIKGHTAVRPYRNVLLAQKLREREFDERGKS
jgi:hypothetical protein